MTPVIFSRWAIRHFTVPTAQGSMAASRTARWVIAHGDRPAEAIKRSHAMKFLGRMFGLFTGGLMLASIAGMLAAIAAKQRIQPLDAPDADDVRLTAIFEPLSFRSTATQFRGGTVDCWYGGGVIDLREAVLDPAGAHLEVRAIVGGAQIVVPESWRVSSNVLGIGGLGDGRPRVDREATAPHLTIEGLAVFGGFGVTSDLPEAAARGLDETVARTRARRGEAAIAEVAPAN
jgi:hypothetical protein